MNKKNIIIYIFAFLAVLSIIVVKPILNLDEIWNYNTAKQVLAGNLPYRDISMITTPLTSIILAMFLKISNQVLTTRIIAAALWAAILLISYNILKILIKKEDLCIIFVTIFAILCRNIFCVDYNCLMLLITLIIVYIELLNKKEKQSLKVNFVIRFIRGTCNMYKTYCWKCFGTSNCIKKFSFNSRKIRNKKIHKKCNF